MARSNYSGVYVVFNRKVILGKYASKTHSKSFSPFESINYDYFGEVNSEGLNIREELLPKIDPNFKVKVQPSKCRHHLHGEALLTWQHSYQCYYPTLHQHPAYSEECRSDHHLS